MVKGGGLNQILHGVSNNSVYYGFLGNCLNWQRNVWPEKLGKLNNYETSFK